MDANSKNAFDDLVAVLSSEERLEMLNKLKKDALPTVQLVKSEMPEDDEKLSLHLKYKDESIFYRFFLWLRSIFSKRSSEDIYNDDLLNGIAKNINREYPGLINHRSKMLDTVFYDRLSALKDGADFFKSYFTKIDENIGDFYIFLSSFIVPEFSEKLGNVVDPFTLSFETEPTNEVRNSLLKKLDDNLKNINPEEKDKLYKAVSSVNWLEHFSRLPFIHFTSQFYDIIGDSHSCYYRNAKEDFNVFASVFDNVQSIESEVLEAIILFSSNNYSGNDNNNTIANGITDEVDIENAVKEFLTKSNEYLSSIQMFISYVPVLRLGKIINNDYDWVPEQVEGVEAWFKNFRNSWRSVIDIRWNKWLIERRKSILKVKLKEDFNLPDFPSMKYTPWQKTWTRVPFTSELRGGFLTWFQEVYYEKILAILNIVIMEGVFSVSDNRSLYSEGLNSFVQSMNGIKDLQLALSPEGEYGAFFEENVNNKIHSFQVQSKIDSVISEIEVCVNDCVNRFIEGCKMMETIFSGIFDCSKNVRQDMLQNFMSIKGLKNKEWRDSLVKARTLLNKGAFYINELDAIESGKNV